jgi:hypothetical protein
LFRELISPNFDIHYHNDDSNSEHEGDMRDTIKACLMTDDHSDLVWRGFAICTQKELVESFQVTNVAVYIFLKNEV